MGAICSKSDLPDKRKSSIKYLDGTRLEAEQKTVTSTETTLKPENTVKSTETTLEADKTVISTETTLKPEKTVTSTETILEADKKTVTSTETTLKPETTVNSTETILEADKKTVTSTETTMEVNKTTVTSTETITDADKKTESSTEWLNKQFVEEILRESEGDASIIVQELDVAPAVGKGENYSCVLHRVAVKYNQGQTAKQCSLIVKSIPDGELMAKLLIEGGIFQNEENLYLNILPAIHRLQSSINDAADALAPLAYKTSRPYTLVLQDLVSDGFKMAVRREGLDLEHTKLALRTMARFHGLSVGLLNKDPKCFDAIVEPLYREDKREMNKTFIEPIMGIFTGVVEKWEGFERFGPKFRNLDWVDGPIEMVNSVSKVGVTKVLNHGDSWTNNMMFKYDSEGKLMMMKYVDFQLSRYNSPAFDLHYFLYASPNEEVRVEHWDEIIAEYHREMTKTLIDVGCESKIFTLEDLHAEIKDKMLFGLLTASTILPIVLVDPEDAPDLSKFTEDKPDGANIGKTFEGKRFQQVFQRILLHFESLGVI